MSVAHAQQLDEMVSAFKKPDPKRQFGGRLRASVLDKVEAIRELWRERAALEGADEDALKRLDLTFVVDHLLAKAADDELAHFGGYPDDEDKMRAAKAALRKASKQ